MIASRKTTRRARRRWGIVLTAATLVTITAATVLATWIAASLPWTMGDRLVLVGDILAASTVLLALLGGLVAVAAYAAATARPHLEVEVTFRFSFPNEPVLQMAPSGTGSVSRAIAPWRQCEATVQIHNRSSHSARNPAVRIDLIGMGGIGGSTAWMPIHFASTVGATGVQWEGGADYPIHGNWTRELPTLDFAGVDVYSIATAGLSLELVADGFRSESLIPVRLLEEDEYSNYSRERFDRLKAKVGSDR